jgi:hypothetical protein
LLGDASTSTVVVETGPYAVRERGAVALDRTDNASGVAGRHSLPD